LSPAEKDFFLLQYISICEYSQIIIREEVELCVARPAVIMDFGDGGIKMIVSVDAMNPGITNQDL
jgi:hypothetical protein